MLLTGKKIASTESTPEVVLDPNGVITVKGRSMNKNAVEFYSEIEKWIDIYISDPAELTCVYIYLEYLNGLNSMIFISLLKKISDVRLKNKEFIINWYFEEDDDDMLAHGEKISSILDLPINLIMISESIDENEKTGHQFARKG